MVFICRTLRLEEASWLDCGMQQHYCKEENPLLHKRSQTLTILLGRWWSSLQPSLLSTEIRNWKGVVEEHCIAKDGGPLPSPSRKLRVVVIQDFVLMGPEVVICQMDIHGILHPDDGFLSQFPGFLGCLGNTTVLRKLG